MTSCTLAGERPTITKGADETRNFEVGVGRAMRENDTIRSVDSVTGEPAGLTIADVTHTATLIRFSIAGGAPGGTYTLRLRWTTEGGGTLEALVWLDVRPSTVASDALSPWPTEPDAEAAATQRLARTIGCKSIDRARDLGTVAAARVEREAPAAPAAVKDEAVIRFSGYLLGSESSRFGTLRDATVGPMDASYTTNHAPAWRHSGAYGLLSPWKVRRGRAFK